MLDNIEEPVRILHWGMLGGRGGIEMFIMNLYRKIDREKVQFDFLDAHDHSQPFTEEINDLGGRVYNVMYTQREAPFSACHRLRRFYREHPEIRGVHVHANFRYALPLKVAKQEGIDLRILHSHNSQEVSLYKSPVNRALADAHNFIADREINRYPSHFFACSDTAAKYMFPGKPYIWVRNGIDTSLYDFSPSERDKVRSEFRIRRDTVVIGFCGRLREQKNPIFAVDVFAQYHSLNPNSVFLILGNGELETMVRHRVSAYGLSSQAVRFLGGERDDVHRIYQAMDILLMPSRYEGLPLVLIEAQTAGLSCLASEKVITDQARVTDLVRFEPLSRTAEEWAAGLAKLSQSIPSRRGHVDEVRANGFDMDTTASLLCKFYLANAGRREHHNGKKSRIVR